MLKINNAYKEFNLTGNDIDKRVALNNINLEIEDGDFITVIGGNGSGKSTLLNCIAGTYLLDNGSISIDDKDITNDAEHKRAKYLGRVFQDPNIGTCKDMSILENLMIASRRDKKLTFKWGFDAKKYDEFKSKLKLLNLGLEDRLETKVGLLSGGQRQAVTLIMATLNRPKLLLLDEHTAALDPKTASKVLDFTDKIVNNEKITTLMITHNMKDAIKFGNRLIMLNQGEIVLDIKGEEKKNITIDQLLKKFEDSIDDKLVLSK